MATSRGATDDRPRRAAAAPPAAIDRVTAWAAAGPVLALGAVTLLMIGAALFGAHPMWQPRTLNMTEAAAARDVATIAARLERGEDPDARHAVRPPLLDGAAGDMTPLEAGVMAGRLEVVHLLLTRGARVDAVRRRELACEAERRGYGDVAAFLAGNGDAAPCGRGDERRP